MAQIGYHASHEQFSPSELVRYAIMAEKAGFKAINSSDHFHPWGEAQGQSGYSFAWLGAAMQATSLPFGVVCAPGQRYHPAIVAQAAATLSEMFPGRFSMALGSGEAINERINGDRWPAKGERNERLLECADIIKRLLNGEMVSHKGLVTVNEARLYTLPAAPPPLMCAALSAETAAWAGSWADGLLTAHKPYEQLKQVVDAFRNNGGAGKPIYLKVQLSYARKHDEALQGAFEQWKTNIFQGIVLGDMPGPAHFDAAARFVKPEDMYEHVRISSDIEQHIEWLQEDIRLGFEKIILHNVNRDQETFMQDFGNLVLPQLD
jgi:coenzyme F420-dependent glucose-6-phosphate dehydrogenase